LRLPGKWDCLRSAQPDDFDTVWLIRWGVIYSNKYSTDQGNVKGDLDGAGIYRNGLKMGGLILVAFADLVEKPPGRRGGLALPGIAE